ncbi:uncharacterized protein LOC142890768 [Nelusetta ayraudi]|uniref:uncharacterized protein LOC142890768 n=1 Tax=Nelusetta ayraudi TaxID=303726 RepID=UPI003F71508C
MCCFLGLRICPYICLSCKAASQNLSIASQKSRRMKFSIVCAVCVCCPLLLLLWPELAEGRALGLSDMLRVSKKLQGALAQVQEEMSKTAALSHLLPSQCTGSMAPLQQTDVVLQNLSQLRSCSLQLLQVDFSQLSPSLCHVIRLSQDLAEHLSSTVDPTDCPSSPPPPRDYDAVRSSMECFSCWMQQVELVHSALTHIQRAT